MFRCNGYHGSVFFSTANTMVGDLYTMTGNMSSYINLREVNDTLEAENERLRLRIAELEGRIKDRRHRTEIDSTAARYHLVGAHVINNTIHRSNNLMTIDKGEKDGIRTEMGVVCSKGVVGIIGLTGDHYSIVMPLLNVNSQISCRLSQSSYFGTMEWTHGNLRTTHLSGIPRHAEVKIGETVETNGYSDIFPEGLPIGKVTKVLDSSDGLSYMLTVELFTDFATLRNVSVITNYTHADRRELERKAEEQLRKEDL